MISIFKRLFNRQIRLLVTGSPYHATEACEAAFSVPRWQTERAELAQLQKERPDYIALLDQLRRVDGWYHVGGHTLPQMYNLDLIRESKRLKAPLIIHWIGSDILTMAEEFEKRPEIREAARTLTHWVSAPWFVEELANMGLHASFVPITNRTRSMFLTLEPPPLPSTFRILSYIPDARQTFYGWEHIVRLAYDFPAIEFQIVRGSGQSVSGYPANIRFLGWLDDIYPAYESSTLTVRMIEHDGYSGTVQEALLLGRYAIWTYPFHGALYAKEYETLHGHVSRLVDLHDQGELRLNEEGRDYIQHRLHPDLLMKRLRQRLRKIIASR